MVAIRLSRLIAMAYAVAPATASASSVGIQFGAFAIRLAAAPEERKKDSTVIHCLRRVYLEAKSPKYSARVSAAGRFSFRSWRRR